jgi:PhnB protein
MPGKKSRAGNTSVVPANYNAVMPYLRINGADRALAFYVAAFGAKERMRLVMGNRIGHAELELNGAVIMLSDEFPEMGILGPKSIKGTTVTLCVYVADADAAIASAVAAGATVKRPAQDEFYGARTGQVEDPFGHVWMLQQHLADVTPAEMQKRLDAMMAEGAKPSGKIAKQKPAKKNA